MLCVYSAIICSTEELIDILTHAYVSHYQFKPSALLDSKEPPAWHGDDMGSSLWLPHIRPHVRQSQVM